MVNLELVALKVKCDRQYQTIVKLQDEKIDLFKENQQLKERTNKAINYIDQVIMYKPCAREIDEELNILIGILRGESDEQ